MDWLFRIFQIKFMFGSFDFDCSRINLDYKMKKKEEYYSKLACIF